MQQPEALGFFDQQRGNRWLCSGQAPTGLSPRVLLTLCLLLIKQSRMRERDAASQRAGSRGPGMLQRRGTAPGLPASSSSATLHHGNPDTRGAPSGDQQHHFPFVE